VFLEWEAKKLFVFPDRSYIFTIVSDIPPDTISDKGNVESE